MLIPFLLVLFGAPTKNPADCAVLNAGLKMACEREIRAGRSFEIPPAPSDAATWSLDESQPERPKAQPTTPEERIAAATERTARATETMATIMVVSLCLTVVSMVVLLVAVK